MNNVARQEEIVDGVYQLGPLLTRSIERTVYETEFGAGKSAIPAMISIREVEGAKADARELAHPNLLKIYASGSCVLNGVPVFYVVMERAEESLDGVLAERALTENETREMLGPALDGLEYLHKKGYAHTRLKAANVLAVNDQLKLSTDCVVRAGEGEAAEDMRALGVLITQALTQKIPNADEHWGLQDFGRMPQPLADIVQHCLDPDRARRWTAEQVKARLKPPAVLKEVPPPVVEEDAVADEPKAGMPKWIFAALAGLILVVVLAAVMRSHQPAAVVTPVAAADVVPTDVAPTAVAPTAAAPQITAPRLIAPATPARKAGGWSVIVGAYRSRELAEKRVHELTTRWPKFNISVLQTQGEKAPYLLVLGQGLSEDQAQALRQRAAQSGLPRDTYIKRLM